MSAATLDLILPVGISFYTFHGLSYIFDIYSKRIKSERNIVTYSVFVSFSASGCRANRKGNASLATNSY